MTTDELWDKYSHYGLINKEGFVKAIAEIISLPVEAQVSDDFCEWKEQINNWGQQDGYDTDCGEYFYEREDYYKYCPNCGKKIKIIKDDSKNSR